MGLMEKVKVWLEGSSSRSVRQLSARTRISRSAINAVLRGKRIPAEKAIPLAMTVCEDRDEAIDILVHDFPWLTEFVKPQESDTTIHLSA